MMKVLSGVECSLLCLALGGLGCIGAIGPGEDSVGDPVAGEVPVGKPPTGPGPITNPPVGGGTDATAMPDNRIPGMYPDGGTPPPPASCGLAPLAPRRMVKLTPAQIATTVD